MKGKVKLGGIRLPEPVTAVAAFAYYFIMALYKLTYTPIWQDEAMEFYCSIPVKGEITGVTKFASMYERMAHIQQQPPLYNWLMCMWLMVDEGEWWYRFSSVIFGFIAAIGIYFIIRKLCDRYMAAFCVIIYSSVYTMMYYIKEASEYSLLVMLIFWLVYAWILLCENINVKYIIAFTLLSTLAVFTHYGAMFVAVPFGISVLVMAWRSGNHKAFWTALGLFATIGGIGGGCLVCFFVLPQALNHVSTLFSDKEIIIEYGSIFGDFLNSLVWVFKWCAIDMDRDWEKIGSLVIAAMIAIALLIIFTAIKSRRDVLRKYLYCNIGVYLFYYTVTKLNLYAYGWYGNRYNMFIFPLWFILIAASAYEFVRILNNSSYAAFIPRILQTCFVAAGILYCVYGAYRVKCHWLKMDLRTVVSEWYARDGYETPTLLDFHQRYSFVYYFTHNEKYEESQWENIIYNDEVETYSANNTAIWKDYLNKIYGSNMPDELYLVTGYWNKFAGAFVELGYEAEAVVDTTAKLYYMKR